MRLKNKEYINHIKEYIDMHHITKEYICEALRWDENYLSSVLNNDYAMMVDIKMLVKVLNQDVNYFGSNFDQNKFKVNVIKEKPKYSYSWDDEYYYGIYNSEKEAINAALNENPNAKEVYIGMCDTPELEWCSNEEDIIESIYDNLSDNVGEAADNFEVSIEQELELAKMIDETVKIWIEQNKIEPKCFRILNGHKVIIKKREL